MSTVHQRTEGQQLSVLRVRVDLWWPGTYVQNLRRSPTDYLSGSDPDLRESSTIKLFLHYAEYQLKHSSRPGSGTILNHPYLCSHRSVTPPALQWTTQLSDKWLCSALQTLYLDLCGLSEMLNFSLLDRVGSVLVVSVGSWKRKIKIIWLWSSLFFR